MKWRNSCRTRWQPVSS